MHFRQPCRGAKVCREDREIQRAPPSRDALYYDFTTWIVVAIQVDQPNSKMEITHFALRASL